MISVFVFIILFIVFFFVFKKDGTFERFGQVAASVVLSFAISLLLDAVLLGTTYPTQEQKTCELVATQEIVALRDNSSTSGSFFLGTGSVGQDEYYVYYSSTEHGYKMEKISADSSRYPVYIKYISSDETPHIDQYSLITREVLVKKPSIWVSLIGYLSYEKYDVGEVVNEERNSPGLLSDSNGYDNYRIEIYIPEGSIQENYEIDLE